MFVYAELDYEAIRAFCLRTNSTAFLSPIRDSKICKIG